MPNGNRTGRGCLVRLIRHDPAFGIATEIVRREFANANSGGELLDDMPDQLLRYSFAPNSTGAAHTPEKAARVNSGGPLSIQPIGYAPNPEREWYERDQPFLAGLRLPNVLRAAEGGRLSAARVPWRRSPQASSRASSARSRLP